MKLFAESINEKINTVNLAVVPVSSNGTYEMTFTAVSTNSHIAVQNAVASTRDFYVDDFSVEEITTTGFLADIRQATDYSPFGVTLEGRNLTLAGMEDYRYSFQGQKHDDEIKGDGNSINYTYRMHDPRLGRFFAIDPLAGKYPHYTPYSFSGNKVINAIELEGLEEIYVYNVNVDENGKKKSINRNQNADYVNNQLQVNIRKFVFKDPEGNTTKIKYAVILPNGNNGSYLVYNSQQEAVADYQNWLHFFNNSISSSSPAKQSSSSPYESAEKLEATLRGYADEAWNKGNYLDAVSYKFKAWGNGYEGETGLYRKGIPTMAATVGTILTFGTGSGIFGGAAISGGINSGGNLLGQYGAKGNFSDIDYASVALAFGSGFLKNPFASTIGINALDGAIDINGKGQQNVLFINKSVGKFSNDMIWGMTGNYLGSKTSSPASNFMIGAGSQYGNTVTDEKIE